MPKGELFQARTDSGQQRQVSAENATLSPDGVCVHLGHGRPILLPLILREPPALLFRMPSLELSKNVQLMA